MFLKIVNMKWVYAALTYQLHNIEDDQIVNL
jgi:hypothetical protein